MYFQKFKVSSHSRNTLHFPPHTLRTSRKFWFFIVIFFLIFFSLPFPLNKKYILVKLSWELSHISYLKLFFFCFFFFVLHFFIWFFFFLFFLLPFFLLLFSQILRRSIDLCWPERIKRESEIKHKRQKKKKREEKRKDENDWKCFLSFGTFLNLFFNAFSSLYFLLSFLTGQRRSHYSRQFRCQMGQKDILPSKYHSMFLSSSSFFYFFSQKDSRL